MGLSSLPWWTWFACGIGSLLLASFLGRIADTRGSTPADILRLLAGFVGIMCIVVGILELVP